MKIKDIELVWLGHACFKIKIAGKVIYIDPYQLDKVEEKADYILITHSHYDHCSIEDLAKLIKPTTIVIATPDCQSKIMKLQPTPNIKIAQPNVSYEFDNFKLDCIEAYNIGKDFHQKIQAWVGYIVITDDIAIFHAGDTDVIPEHDKLKQYAEKYKLIMLLPVGGTYTMNWKEASELAIKIKPYMAIPMHYASIVGSIDDAEQFVDECNKHNVNAVLLDKEA